ncbi:hypothetical protein ANCCAN_20941 [Ancylostoma caninum]|uniref:Uncharacterized protein n=1 Tax=Ancylostoma caninum TaxID=29170 RepID=A0A368FQD5_ANCCA|nr:hypothetical protein ANCCAN_20941 [Ancylostoma caninum]
MRRSKSALVTVNVKETCVQGHTGLTDRCVRTVMTSALTSLTCTDFLLTYRLSYVAGDGPKLILPDVQTHVCEQESACDVQNAHSTVKLRAGHVTKGCSRDTVFSNETIQSCGLSPATVSLLPSKSVFPEEAEADVVFDGVTNAVIVPKQSVPEIVPDRFSLSFSMKHARGTKDDQKNKKNILCESDEAGRVPALHCLYKEFIKQIRRE